MKPESFDVLNKLIVAGWYISIERPPERERLEDWAPDWVSIEATRARPDGDTGCVIAGVPQLLTLQYTLRVAGAHDKAVTELERLCRAAIP
jgi:hypothetical protein